MLCSSSRRLFTRTMPPALFTYQSETLAGISHFSTSSPDSPFSSSNHSSARRDSEDSCNPSVFVWWDLDDCSVPRKADGLKITECIKAAVRANGIMGRIHITAYCNTFKLSKSNRVDLPPWMNLYHVDPGYIGAYPSLLFDITTRVSKNPPPEHHFLISGNKNFACILHRLRMNNYNILLACPDNAPAVLCGAACIMWQWTSLIKGENLSGSHFNQPPIASWYGHYKASLETRVPNTSTKDVVPVMDYKENGGQNPSREEKVLSPSKLNVPKFSTNSEEPPEKQEEPEKVQEQPCVIEKAKEGKLSLDQLHPIEMREAIPEVGILKKIWRKWFRDDDDYQEKIFYTVNEKVNPDVKCVQSTGQSSDTGKLPPSSISTNEVITEAEMNSGQAQA